LLAAGVVGGYSKARAESLVLALVLLGKLAYEQIAGPLPGSEQSTGGAVVVVAHLYGAIAGVVAAAILAIRSRLRRSI
jgi:membrane associated rhomboid family serine protease